MTIILNKVTKKKMSLLLSNLYFYTNLLTLTTSALSAFSTPRTSLPPAPVLHFTLHTLLFSGSLGPGTADRMRNGARLSPPQISAGFIARERGHPRHQPCYN